MTDYPSFFYSLHTTPTTLFCCIVLYTSLCISYMKCLYLFPVYKSHDRPQISLFETKGVINYAELVSDRKKRLLAIRPSDFSTPIPPTPITTTTTTNTTITPTKKPATLNNSMEEAGSDTADESVDGAADESVEGSMDASKEDVKKMSPKRSVCIYTCHNSYLVYLLHFISPHPAIIFLPSSFCFLPCSHSHD